MSDDAVFSTIKKVVGVVAKDPAIRCDVGSNFLTDLGLSSLSLVLLMTEVCERTGFNILNFSDRDLATLNTVQDLIVLLRTKG